MLNPCVEIDLTPKNPFREYYVIIDSGGRTALCCDFHIVTHYKDNLYLDFWNGDIYLMEAISSNMVLLWEHEWNEVTPYLVKGLKEIEELRYVESVADIVKHFCDRPYGGLVYAPDVHYQDVVSFLTENGMRDSNGK